MGASNSAVVWTVDGIPGGNGQMGTISASGMYQAPGVLPATAQMTVAASSEANPASSGAAVVTVTSDVRVQINPAPASVAAGASVQLTATISSAGHPSTALQWSVSGAGCAASAGACGVISSAGLYTAPGAPPQPASVTVTATSVADPSQSANALLLVSSAAAISISPAGGSVALERSIQFSAFVGGATTEEIIWSVNGIPGGNTAAGTISNSPAMNGLYLAPVNMPAGRAVSISATSTTNPGLPAVVTLQLTSNIAVTINPTSATRIPGARQTFSASISGSSNLQITWTVNDIPNGTSSTGQTCQTASNPCLAPPIAGPAGGVDYLAPASAPVPPQATVKAVSVADPARFAAAVVMIAAQVAVSISPQAVTLPPGQVQALAASVQGVADQNVVWDVNGSPNGSIANGVICLEASNPCQAPDGATASAVEYRAPAAPPMPNTVTVRATSEAAATAQASSHITISTAPFITGLAPASLFAGPAAPFELRVRGVLFAPSQPGPGASILVNGAARETVCADSTECSTLLDPADAAAAGTLSISVVAPGTPAATSNAVPVIVAAPELSVTVIPLNAATSNATGMDIAVVEPTFAGNDPPEVFAFLEIGMVDPSTGACTLGIPPLALPRPATGSATSRLCAFGTSLDQVKQLWFSSPAAADITTANLDASQGSVYLEFDVTIFATASTGPRTLFAQSGNLDVTSQTAALEVH